MFDLDGDGWENIIIGSGRDGPMSIYHNRDGKTFERDTNNLLSGPVARDQATILGVNFGHEQTLPFGRLLQLRGR